MYIFVYIYKYIHVYNIYIYNIYIDNIYIIYIYLHINLQYIYIYTDCVHLHQDSNQVQADEKKDTDGVAPSEELQD